MGTIDTFVGAVKVRSGKKALGKALSLSVLNQVVNSGTNFALGIYLARVLLPADFGLYGIGFAVCLFYSGVGNALFLTQMVVYTPDRAPDDRLPYAARMFTAVTLFCTLTFAVAGLLFGSMGLASDRLADFARLGVAVVGISVTYLLKDFFVRHAYTVRNEGWALAVNSATAVALLMLVLGTRETGATLTASGALWLYAIASFAGAIAGLALTRLPLRTTRLARVADDVRQAWAGGRWALGGVSITWLQSQAYMYITALFAGPVGVGYANAARLLVTPVLFLVTAISQVAMPRLTDLRATNLSKMFQAGGIFTLGVVGAAIVYSGILLAVVDFVAPALLGAQYERIAPLVAAWCLVMTFQLARSGTVVILQVLRQFRSLALTNAASATVTLLACLLLTQLIGIQGAILGVALGELVFAIWLWKLTVRVQRGGATAILP